MQDMDRNSVEFYKTIYKILLQIDILYKNQEGGELSNFLLD